MALFGGTLESRPYVIEFEDGTEVKVDAYDVQEAMFTGVLKRNQECGEGEGPRVVSARPDADALRQRRVEDSEVRRLLGSVLASKLARDPDPEEAE